jgi:Kazal-type serine protease inhibitor domain
MMLAGCGAEKPALPAPDFGDEDAKLDSAKAPASFVDIAFGESKTASFTSKSQYRAFRFDGKKGQKVSVFVDGKSGLDTVAYLYKATEDHPWGKVLATNDDTDDTSWTKNPFSSHFDFVLPDTRGYAVVATTYFGDRGSANVTVKTPDASCGGFAGIACAAGQYCELPAGMCAGRDLMGVCKPQPQVCIEIYKPVCGCDGRTYGNDCSRQGSGVQLDHQGACLLTQAAIDDAARAHVYGNAGGQTIYASESAAETADQAHPIDGYWLARDGAGFVSGLHDLWAQKFTVDNASGEVTVTAEH